MRAKKSDYHAPQRRYFFVKIRQSRVNDHQSRKMGYKSVKLNCREKVKRAANRSRFLERSRGLLTQIDCKTGFDATHIFDSREKVFDGEA